MNFKIFFSVVLFGLIGFSGDAFGMEQALQKRDTQETKRETVKYLSPIIYSQENRLKSQQCQTGGLSITKDSIDIYYTYRVVTETPSGEWLKMQITPDVLDTIRSRKSDCFYLYVDESSNEINSHVKHAIQIVKVDDQASEVSSKNILASHAKKHQSGGNLVYNSVVICTVEFQLICETSYRIYCKILQQPST